MVCYKMVKMRYALRKSTKFLEVRYIQCLQALKYILVILGRIEGQIQSIIINVSVSNSIFQRSTETFHLKTLNLTLYFIKQKIKFSLVIYIYFEGSLNIVLQTAFMIFNEKIFQIFSNLQQVLFRNQNQLLEERLYISMIISNSMLSAKSQEVFFKLDLCFNETRSLQDSLRDSEMIEEHLRVIQSTVRRPTSLQKVILLFRLRGKEAEGNDQMVFHFINIIITIKPFLDKSINYSQFLCITYYLVYNLIQSKSQRILPRLLLYNFLFLSLNSAFQTIYY
ncbi:unnamed protein product [Paramecium primaurelia]|uniref:Transmembrane protein n=1 Tax=Paramecium primaurelia TaxID=5886 RepID=A0A8S1KKZ7_PARPR|nr:unnamed protein product [Paramecium primaurelia]